MKNPTVFRVDSFYCHLFQVYIAEAAQLLIQSVAYDIPALKKHIQKCAQTQEECDKKVISNDRKIEEFKNDFQVQVPFPGVVVT